MMKAMGGAAWRWAAMVAILAMPSQALAWDEDEVPDEDWVWEDGHQLGGGRVDEGFYRPRAMPGYEWVDGHYEGSTWVPGDFRPAGRPPAAGMVWEAGFRSSDGFFVAGSWRPAARQDSRWVPRRRVGQSWAPGYWEPVMARRGHVWVPGFWTPQGVWVDGFWRPVRRPGFRWVDGGWRFGRWEPGYWQPTRTRRGEVWVRGHWGPGGWVDGFWRPNARPGHRWERGFWGPDGRWVQGRWAPGARGARRHALPRDTRAMMRERAGFRHEWRNGQRMERREDRRDRRMERREDRRDRRMERREDRRDRRMDRQDRRQDRRDRR